MLKKLTNAIRQKILYGIAVYSSLTAFYATPTTAFGRGIDNFFSNLLKEIAAIYCGSLWLVLLAINLVWLGWCKNERVIPVLKKSLIIIIVVYIALRVLTGNSGILTNTANTVESWIK